MAIRSKVKLVSSIFAIGAVFACSGADNADIDVSATAPPPTETADPTQGFGRGDGTSGPDDTQCAATLVETQKAQVDVVFVIDNSGSMSDEMDQVKLNVNSFASKILRTGLDVHVIMIADRGTGALEICVPPPLGGANCADNLPTFFQVDQNVASTNSFALILSTYESANPRLGWRDKLRPGATKVFVDVTDDRSQMSYADFDRALLAKQPAGMFGTASARKYVWHSIVSKPSADRIPSANICAGAAGSSVDYQRLSQATGGIVDEVCKTNYSAVLDNIARESIRRLRCDLTYPRTEATDPTKVVVEYSPAAAAAQTLAQVTDPSKCAAEPDGWYYDDNTNPTRIILCPRICALADDAKGGKLAARVGCKAPTPK